ncbi:hypothetical protein FS837_002035 [Tulasnella sp. UAMH 9824]|nr:hypothetical protein FS837_002035 [Tulasnella sp. UAMH 9824]
MASQTDIREYDVPFFTGNSAEEAEDFIQAVNRRAYAAGKQKDNAWIAEFAYPFFSRKALRWYDGLDEVTQNDWKLLRSAILAEFTGGQPTPSTVPSAAPAVISSSSRYTPAAPPPPRTKMVGRIRVDSEDPEGRGYLAVKETESSVGVVCRKIAEASLFEVDILGRTLRIKGEGENLVIKASAGNESLRPGTGHSGYIARSSTSLGKEWSNTWSVTGDGNAVTSSLQADGRKCDAKFLVYRNDNANLQIPADIDRFLALYDSYTVGTLHFEPMS